MYATAFAVPFVLVGLIWSFWYRPWKREFGFRPPLTPLENRIIEIRQSKVDARLAALFIEMLAWFTLEEWVKTHILDEYHQAEILRQIESRKQAAKKRAWHAQGMARRRGFRYNRKAQMYLMEAWHWADLESRFRQLRARLVDEMKLDEALLYTE